MNATTIDIEAPTSAPAPGLPHRGARVLLAEDHPVNQALVEMLLAELGIAVDIVDDGLEALERLQAQTYDLLLMDIHMPRLDGLSAARAVRGMPGHAALPIVAMTASPTQNDRDTCLGAGMNDFIDKPIMADRFFAVVSRWLEVRLRG